MSDYGDMCRELKKAKSDVRAEHGVPCPECVKKLPKANPSILLPQQRCKIHKYLDPRPRTLDTDYFLRAGYTEEKPLAERSKDQK